MAKKTTKTTTKTVTKSSKKDLIIGISIAAVVAVAAAITIPLVLLNKGGDQPSEVQFSVDERTVELQEDNKTAVVNLNWEPSDHSIECSDFTFKLVNQPTIDSEIKWGKVGSRPLELTVTFAKALEKDDTGELRFNYKDKTAGKDSKGMVKGIEIKLHEKPPVPPVTETWTLKLDSNSEKYGKLKYKTQEAYSVTIDDFIGKTDPIPMTFIPNGDYTETKFTITATDAKEGTVTIDSYSAGTTASFYIKKAEGFADGDIITLKFKEPEPEVATFSIDSDTYGTLTYGEQSTTTSVDISDKIGNKSVTITFVPETEYEGRDFTFTLDDTSAGDFDLTFENNVITITGKEERTFQDGDNLTATVELVEVATFSIDSDTYGTLTYGEQSTTTSVDISDKIGNKSVTITFVPETEYEGRDFTFTLDDTSAGDFDLTFENNVITITGKEERTFKDGDNLTATVELVKVATIALDSGSNKYGILATTDISDFIDQQVFWVGFTPNEGYKNKPLYIDVIEEGFSAGYDYTQTGNEIKITVTSGVLEDNTSLTLKIQYASATLDETSFNTYGTWRNGAQVADIGGSVGDVQFSVNFVPKEDYIDADFDVTVTGADGVTASYNIDQNDRFIHFEFDSGALEIDTELTVTLTEKELDDPVELIIHRDNGTDPVTRHYERGSTPTAPSNPSYDGYTFEGWYNGTFKTSAAFDFTKALTADTTNVYAHWSLTLNITYNNTLVNSNPCSLTYTPASGTEQTITAGQTVSNVTFKNVSNDMIDIAFFTTLGGNEKWLTASDQEFLNFELLYNGEPLTFGFGDDYQVKETYDGSGIIRVYLNRSTYGKIKNGGDLTINIKHTLAKFQFYDWYESASLTYDGGATHKEFTISGLDDSFTINTDVTTDDATVTFTLSEARSKAYTYLFINDADDVLNDAQYAQWASYDESTNTITVNVGYIHQNFGDIYFIRVQCNVV